MFTLAYNKKQEVAELVFEITGSDVPEVNGKYRLLSGTVSQHNRIWIHETSSTKVEEVSTESIDPTLSNVEFFISNNAVYYFSDETFVSENPEPWTVTFYPQDVATTFITVTKL